MDQIKIGKFIAECRKEKGFTQMQLAEKLGITDKAISKWERGLSMPDSSIMLTLCDMLGISVNELLNGEKIMMENNDRKNEELLLRMAEELEEKNRTVWRSMWVILAVSIIGLMAGLAVSKFLIPEGTWQVISALATTILFCIPAFYALRLEVSIGAYRCRKCGHEFKPTYFQALWPMHMGTTRHLKCPRCGKRTWCKKVFKKQ